ncbi:transposase [Listeria grandensis]
MHIFQQNCFNNDYKIVSTTEAMCMVEYDVKVTLVLKENFSVKEVCNELNIHTDKLYRWISEYEQYFKR